ncbi:MAG: DNRLRE domain-containing protein [Pontiellaceae bacterium]|nr:DNRLRE domain-containing protein [Pontiellaceae bacterium]
MIKNMFIMSRLGRMLAVFALMAAAGFSVYGGDVIGKITVGYQGWFSCAGDGSPLNKWVHWSKTTGTTPSAGNVHFELYPDVREYASSSLYQTSLSDLRNGSKAKLFSSYSTNVVRKHFEWMQTYGIDTVALQRFGVDMDSSSVVSYRNGILTRVKDAAAAYGRKFYVMYDLTEWPNFKTEMKYDWTNRVKSLNITNSSAYAKESSKPVVCIWGVGKEVGDTTSWKDVINFFKGQGCYVIIGVPRQWRTDSPTSAYTNANMISPWTIGGYTTDNDIDNYGKRMRDDKALCDQRGQAYLPVVFPGFAWSNWKPGSTTGDRNEFPRRHGNFMWRQFANIRSNNITSVYVAMFDEYDEGTAIAKAAENSQMIPSNQYFLTLDADGTACSSDFYLRLTKDGGNMIKNRGTLQWTHPTTHTGGSASSSCHIDTPAGNVTKSAGEALYVKVSGFDSDGVDRVKIYTNGVEVASDTSDPYEFNLTVPQAGFTLTAKVKDVLGNYTASDNSIVVTVITSQLATFTSVAAHDGYVDESSSTSNVGGSINATNVTGAGLRIGDTGAKKQRKSILSFDTSSLPDTATVVSATLKLKCGLITNTPSVLGLITVDIKNTSTGFNGSLALESMDFQASASMSGVGTLDYPTGVGAWAIASLNTNGTSRIAKTSHTQFRLRFAGGDDGDAADDYLGFYPGDAVTVADRPVLEVRYQ